ncbi:MAG: hypothetical protein ACI88C_001663 [Acidimicrobiales bacterium]|jgi:hypothetical protein
MGIDRQLLSPNPLTLFVRGATNDGRSAAGDSRLHRFGLDLIVGYTYEETRAGASFVLGGVFDRHPALDVCIPYGGGAIVFLARRFDSMAHYRCQESDFGASLRKLWFDAHFEPGPARDMLTRASSTVKQAIRHGVDLIGHANFLDDEAVDMLAQDRDRLFVGPGIAWEVQLLDRGHEIGLSRAMMEAKGYQHEVDATIDAVKQLRDVGVRIVIGGDYGLLIAPHGSNAKDLEYFVDLFALAAAEALL